MKTANSKARNIVIGKTKERVWFTPTIGQVDLNDAKKAILGANQAILFLMFNPGPKDTLLIARWIVRGGNVDYRWTAAIGQETIRGSAAAGGQGGADPDGAPVAKARNRQATRGHRGTS